jgi:F-type H+-transporting ATPase subunit b
VHPIAAAVAAEAANNVNPIAPNLSETIVGGLCFLLLLAFLYRAVFPRVNQVLKQRSDNIEGKLERAEQERQQAEQLLKEYKDKLADAAEESRRILDEARANADRVRRDLTAKAEQEADRIVTRARDTIRQERDQALAALRREVGNLAVDLATRVIGDTLDRERQLRLVDQYVQELETQGDGNARRR